MAVTTFRIGYLDFDLNNFHAEVYLKLLREDLAARGFSVSACYALQDAPSRAWAAKNHLPFVEDADAMDEMVEGYMLLAPSDPQVHLPLLERVARFGKPVFVDKPVAPDVATTKRLFRLADDHGVAVQTSSALRYTAVQRSMSEIGAGRLQHIVTWSGGRSFEEYGIHPTEMAVSCMGPEVEQVTCRRRGLFTQLLVDFAGGRTATIHVACQTRCPYSATMVFDEAVHHHVVDTSQLFKDAAGAILNFFAAGQAQIDRRETLAVRHILDVGSREKA